jgi:hypothetical protein
MAIIEGIKSYLVENDFPSAGAIVGLAHRRRQGEGGNQCSTNER